MTFKSIAEFLDPENGHKPTTAERKLIAKTRAGEPCILNDPENPTRPTGPSDEVTIRSTLLRLLILGGTKECDLHERGVGIVGGWIEGLLDLAFCTCKGQILFNHCNFTDRPSFIQTTLLQLNLDRSAFPGLNAEGAKIEGSLFLRSVISTGTVNAIRAKIGGQLSCMGATLEGVTDKDDGTLKALKAQGVEVGQSLILRKIKTTGTVDVNAARIVGHLDFEAAVLDGGKDANGTVQSALNSSGVDVGQSFTLRKVKASGSINVTASRIVGSLNCFEASFDGAGAAAFLGARAQIKENLNFRCKTKIKGRVNLTGARVGNLVDDISSWPTKANCLNLNGFTYDQIIGISPTNFSDRHQWLAKGSNWNGNLRPQPYTQLAKVLRQMGHAGEARQVLMERERLLAVHRLESDRKDFRAAYDGGVMSKGDSGKIWLRMRGAQFWAWLTGKVAGYGYAPQRALSCALVCIGVSFFAYMLFWQLGAMVPTDAVILTSVEWQLAYGLDGLRPALVWADPSRSGPATSHYETFYSLPYAFDVFLPIVDLGQQSTWGQTTVTWAGWVARLWTWGLQIAGYVITSLGLAAATGIIQRNQPD